MENTAIAPWKGALAEAESKMAAFVSDPVTIKKELRFALMAMSNNTMLQNAQKQSIIDAVVMIAQTGLTLNPVYKFAYLVPRDGKCVLDIGYQGLAKTLVDAGSVNVIEAFCIWKDEVAKGRFRFDPITQESHYDPYYPETEKEQDARMRMDNLHGVFSVATLTDGTKHKFFLPKWKVEKAKRISPGGNNMKMPWNTFFDEQAKKTGIRAHFKILPKGEISDKLAAVMELEDSNNPVDFSKGKHPSNVAEDIFTKPSTEPEDTTYTEEQPEDPATMPPPGISDQVRDYITGATDPNALIVYVNSLTHLHGHTEFVKLVTDKIKTFPKKDVTEKLKF